MNCDSQEEYDAVVAGRGVEEEANRQAEADAAAAQAEQLGMILTLKDNLPRIVKATAEELEGIPFTVTSENVIGWVTLSGGRKCQITVRVESDDDEWIEDEEV